MPASTFKRWVCLAILIAVIYIVAGVGFGQLDKGAGSQQMVFIWRLAAWVVSAIAFAFHIVYEKFRLRSSTLATASHAALAVALGAFGLAVSANIHRYLTGSGDQRRLMIALIAFPAITAVPAFVVALAAATFLSLLHRRS